MSIITDSCGAVAVFFDPKENPDIFRKDSRYILKKFYLYGKKCALISVGNRISLLKDPGEINEDEVLSFTLPSDIGDLVNTMTVRWFNNEITLSANTTTRKIINAGIEIGNT
ncbi:MAG: hypothetical protein WCS93_02420 [Candidatus Delongbacteria bacterium]